MTDEALHAAADDLIAHLTRLGPDVARRSPPDRRRHNASMKETDMLIHPWDAALDTSEWQDWLASTDRFGILAVNNLDPAEAPLVLPIHFTLAGDDELLMHLARPNPVWPHLEAAAEVRLAVIGDYAYIPTYWRAKAGGPDEDGVPTSYYSAVQFVCRPTVVDDPQGKAEILTAQLADFQPEGRHAAVAVDDGAVRADAVRDPRRPADGAAGGGQVQVRRLQSRRPPPTRHRQSRAARPRPRYRSRRPATAAPRRDR